MSETVAPAAPAAPAAAAPAAAGAAAAPGGEPAVGTAPAAGSDAAAPGATLLGDAPSPDAAQAAEAPVEDKPAEPVVYEDFTLPEGISKDAPMLDAFRQEAGKLGIPQDQAQALVTAVGERIAAEAKAAGAAQLNAWVSTNEAWQAEIMADKEIGGTKFAAMKTSVAKLFDDFVGPVGSKGVNGQFIENPARKALNEALLHTGAGNNPAIVRAIARIAAAHTEGGFVAGSPARGPVDRAALMYPTMGQPNGQARGN
jgi:hypothetical protein